MKLFNDVSNLNLVFMIRVLVVGTYICFLLFWYWLFTVKICFCYSCDKHMFWLLGYGVEEHHTKSEEWDPGNIETKRRRIQVTANLAWRRNCKVAIWSLWWAGKIVSGHWTKSERIIRKTQPEFRGRCFAFFQYHFE